MKKYKVGIVGAGRISKKHFESIATIEDFEIKYVCDTNQETLKNFSKGYETFDNLDDLLKTDVDLVSICTPSGEHASQSIKALEANKTVVCEKPMAIKTGDALKMIEASKKSTGELFIVKQNRFNDTVSKVAELLQEGSLGKIYFISCNVFWTRPQEYYSQAPWRGTWAQDGGAFMNQAIHYFDLVQLFGGPVELASSLTARLERNIEAEDTGTAQLKFKSGAIGSINVTMLTYPKNLEGSITILGEKGTVKISGVALNEITHWDVKDKQAPENTGYKTDSVYGFGHEKFYHKVLDWMNGEPGAITGSDGIKALEIIESCYKSAQQNGSPVHLNSTF